MVTEILLQLA